MKRLVFALLCFLYLESPVLAQFARGQIWTTEKGSTLVITAVTPGGFRGTFTNKSADFFPCNVPSPATATASFAFTMSVNFTKCRATAVWRGDTDRVLAITAPWALTYVDQTGKPQTKYGFDVFFRTR